MVLLPLAHFALVLPHHALPQLALPRLPRIPVWRPRFTAPSSVPPLVLPLLMPPPLLIWSKALLLPLLVRLLLATTVTNWLLPQRPSLVLARNALPPLPPLPTVPPVLEPRLPPRTSARLAIPLPILSKVQETFSALPIQTVLRLTPTSVLSASTATPPLPPEFVLLVPTALAHSLAPPPPLPVAPPPHRPPRPTAVPSLLSPFPRLSLSWPLFSDYEK